MLRSRIVRWLRVILPLAALAILSVVFLIARAPDPGGAIPYADPRLEDHARRPGMTAPQFSTVTPAGATVTLTAASAALAQGGDPAGGRAQDLTLDWRERDGLTLALTAAEAAVDGPRLALSGDVRMRLSSGWQLAAPRIEADTSADQLTATDVAVTAPFGDLSAGAMRLTRGSDGHPVLELNRGVRLLYRP